MICRLLFHVSLQMVRSLTPFQFQTSHTASLIPDNNSLLWLDQETLLYFLIFHIIVCVGAGAGLGAGLGGGGVGWGCRCGWLLAHVYEFAKLL